jgi:hypothetical protein
MNCYDDEPMAPGMVPTYIDTPDGTMRHLDDCTADDVRYTIALEEKAIRWHRSRVGALRRHLETMENNTEAFAEWTGLTVIDGGRQS